MSLHDARLGSDSALLACLFGIRKAPRLCSVELSSLRHCLSLNDARVGLVRFSSVAPLLAGLFGIGNAARLCSVEFLPLRHRLSLHDARLGSVRLLPCLLVYLELETLHAFDLLGCRRFDIV